MKQLMWLLQLLLKTAIFFTLFAFALNNQHDAVVHFFFGTTWSAPLVLVLLTVFVMGIAVGVISMVPRWWRHRRFAEHSRKAAASQTTPSNPTTSIDRTHGI